MPRVSSCCLTDEFQRMHHDSIRPSTIKKPDESCPCCAACRCVRVLLVERASGFITSNDEQLREHMTTSTKRWAPRAKGTSSRFSTEAIRDAVSTQPSHWLCDPFDKQLIDRRPRRKRSSTVFSTDRNCSHPPGNLRTRSRPARHRACADPFNDGAALHFEHETKPRLRGNSLSAPRTTMTARSSFDNQCRDRHLEPRVCGSQKDGASNRMWNWIAPSACMTGQLEATGTPERVRNQGDWSWV